MNMYDYFKLGDTLYWYCQGAFGRDDYETKICVCVRPFYAVFEYENGTATVLNLSTMNSTNYDVEQWKKSLEEQGVG